MIMSQIGFSFYVTSKDVVLLVIYVLGSFCYKEA